ncbi:insulinoma-associated protein 1a [Nasonia vitripennis]|uniref:C2H2-type domain-containing protein n=1 Tax=Nasonia vitripennis TaxID=7425 RepID=A0A7M7G312_NASVI|nr:insulinoma-associated protein 1a [Nasonia vitripennis]
MLHSALPRAYLGYHHPHLAAGSYFEEAVIAAQQQQQQQQQQHPYYQMQQQLDPESYQRVLAWDTSSTPTTGSLHQQLRAATPCPLDLSLKPPPTPSSPRTDEYEPIEVDDEEDRRSREEARSRHSSYSRPDEDVVVYDLDSQRSCSSAHSYQQLPAPYLGAELERTPTKTCSSAKETMMLASLGYQQLLQTPAPMTPPSTPSPPQPQQPQQPQQPAAQRRKREEDQQQQQQHTPKQQQLDKPPRAKKKHARKLKFDEDTSSPVSGTVILGPDEALVTGDIDPAFNIVEVTEEARAELAKIENRLGPYQCKLCRHLHDDAFQLAQHRCSRIAHVEYRCPECDKRFSCPANLASHRRWHKPRPGGAAAATAAAVVAAAASSSASNGSSSGSGSEESGSESLACGSCEAKFSRQAALRKHVAAQHPCAPAAEQNNNDQETKSRAVEMA